LNSIDRLYAEEIPGIVITSEGTVSESLPEKPLVLAGSFNPLHGGHREMLAAASKVTGKKGYLEISIQNVDKPLLARAELDARATKIASAGLPLIVTSAPRFTEKSSVLPGASFVIGYDTCVRLLDEKYYPDHLTGAATAVENSLNLIDENGCQFVVAGRTDDWQVFHELALAEIPQRYRKMFIGLSEAQFRSDTSSTDMRNRPN
jgi:glycerol-3-phosphate cytidylyltransferase-like family protein